MHMQATSNVQFQNFEKFIKADAAGHSFKWKKYFNVEGVIEHGSNSCNYRFDPDEKTLTITFLKGENIRSRLDSPDFVYRQFAGMWTAYTPGSYPDVSTERLATSCILNLKAMG
jgi:hypothetical protein